MSFRAARFSMILMMAIMAPLTLAGCVAPEDEAGTGAEVASEQVAGDETASTDVEKGESHLLACATRIEIRNVTCASGWPGTRGCSWTFSSPTSIVPGTLVVKINGHNGEVGHTASNSTFQVSFTATVREGDAFNPGVNTTSYTVAWLRN